MKDWRLVATALKLQIPEADLDRAQASLESVEAVLRPLINSIPMETEPAFVLLRLPEEKK